MDVMALLRGNTRKVLLATVSGVSSTKPGMVGYFDEEVDAIDLITTKSYQVVATAGNPEPVICEPETGSFGNSVGLRNDGMDAAVRELSRLRRQGFHKLLNVSLAARCPEDFVTLVRAFAPLADLLELNFSCPHAAAGFGSSIGCDADTAASYVRRIRQAVPDLAVPLFVKLTPNVPDIAPIARAVVEAGADGITAINTVGPTLHVDPASKAVILQNQVGGKGGRSGRWIWDDALRCVAAIRRAVGPSVPIIGMGGVDDGRKVAALMAAGANVVGIGSALGMVNQRQWPAYLASVKREAQEILDGKEAGRESDAFLATERSMAYAPYPIVSRRAYGDDIVILTCRGSLPSKAGQFVFVWLPGIGEKPFSVATTDPLSFVIKKRGKVTDALGALQEGDVLYVRGLYGAPVESFHTPRALLVAGGTGVAVLPMLARTLSAEGTRLEMLTGTSVQVPGPALLEDVLAPYGPYRSVADDGKPGRVLGLLEGRRFDEGDAAYLVGPGKFMAAACRILLACGMPKAHIALSMERMTRCGVGLCGECVCGHRLACQWGTFMAYGYLETHAPELLGL